MALSDSFYKNVGSHWRLQLEWSATQDVVANTSKVTVKLYWIARDSYGAISSSATKTSGIQVNGASFVTDSASSKATLKASQKKLIQTYTKTITHKSDGTATVSLDGYFDVDMTLGGTSYSRIDLDEKTFTLNTIPRASVLSTAVNWKAGSNFTVTVSRASSSFRHEAELSVMRADGEYDWIKRVEFSTSQTSKSTSFTQAENEEIFKHLAGRTGATARIVLQTFKGDTLIGEVAKAGTVSAPTASTTSHSGNFNIGDAVITPITRSNSTFTHTVKYYVGGTLIHTKTGVTTSYTWTPTEAEKTKMYGKTPTSNKVASEIRIDTFYGAEAVRTTTKKAGTATVTNSKPIFTNASIAYADTNDTTLKITKDASLIIQNQSTVTVKIPTTSKAEAVNGATMSKYVCNLAGREVSTAYSDSEIIFPFGTINASSDQTLTVKAVDSRGNYTSVTLNVNVIPYSPPVLTGTAKRRNGFDAETVIAVSGTISPVLLGDVQANKVVQVTYRYKKVSEANPTTWLTWTPIEIAQSNTTYKATNALVELDNSVSHNVEIRVEDALSSKTVAVTVSSGKPIVFIDSENNGLSVGKFPDGKGAIESAGAVAIFGGTANAGEFLRFDMSTHAYMSWWLDGVRQGYFGFPSASNNKLTIKNEKTGNYLAVGTELNFDGHNVKHEGNLMVARGAVTITPTEANKPTSITVSFGKTFPGKPTVMATANTSVPGQTVTGLGVTAVTEKDCLIWCTRTNTTATNVMWLAVWDA